MNTINDITRQDIKEIRRLARSGFAPDSICKRYKINNTTFDLIINFTKQYRKLGPVELEQIKTLLIQGFKPRYIARHFGVCEQYIRELRRKKFNIKKA